jgi:hypothetical protein
VNKRVFPKHRFGICSLVGFFLLFLAGSPALAAVRSADDVALYKAHWEFTGMADAEGKALPPMKLLGACVLVKRDGKWLMAAFFSRPAGK